MFKSDARSGEGEEIGASLITPQSDWKLQQALHDKAKREPACRFHSLYDKLNRKDVLLHAWEQCRANGGAPGVDGQTFGQIERSGRDRWLDELGRNCEKRAIGPKRCVGCGYPSPAATS